MGNAIWLVSAAPFWYLSALLVPFSGGALTLIPAVGALSLAVGVIIGIIQRRRQLLLFALPVALSEILLAIAGIMRGRVPMTGSTALDVGELIFIAVQFAICGYLIYFIRGARISASALGIFSISYAAFSVFVAGMSFTDTWL